MLLKTNGYNAGAYGTLPISMLLGFEDFQKGVIGPVSHSP